MHTSQVITIFSYLMQNVRGKEELLRHFLYSKFYRLALYPPLLFFYAKDFSVHFHSAVLLYIGHTNTLHGVHFVTTTMFMSLFFLFHLP